METQRRDTESNMGWEGLWEVVLDEVTSELRLKGWIGINQKKKISEIGGIACTVWTYVFLSSIGSFGVELGLKNSN